jgi:hypothetical protein
MEFLRPIGLFLAIFRHLDTMGDKTSLRFIRAADKFFDDPSGKQKSSHGNLFMTGD